MNSFDDLIISWLISLYKTERKRCPPTETSPAYKPTVKRQCAGPKVSSCPSWRRHADMYKIFAAEAGFPCTLLHCSATLCFNFLVAVTSCFNIFNQCVEASYCHTPQQSQLTFSVSRSEPKASGALQLDAATEHFTQPPFMLLHMLGYSAED